MLKPRVESQARGEGVAEMGQGGLPSPRRSYLRHRAGAAHAGRRSRADHRQRGHEQNERGGYLPRALSRPHLAVHNARSRHNTKKQTAPITLLQVHVPWNKKAAASANLQSMHYRTHTNANANERLCPHRRGEDQGG